MIKLLLIISTWSLAQLLDYKFHCICTAFPIMHGYPTKDFHFYRHTQCSVRFAYFFLHVNNNGIVSLNSSYTSYNPTAFPFSSNGPIIAAFFADIDTTGSGGGYVTYRITTDATLLAKAVHDIPPILSGPNFVPVWLLIATWDHVGYFSSHYDKVSAMKSRACACILISSATNLPCST